MWRIIAGMGLFRGTLHRLPLVLLALLLACIPAKKTSARRTTPAPQPARTKAPVVAREKPQARTAQQESRPPQSAGRDFAHDMVDAHNEARARAQPAPKPALPVMGWSADAARKAASWAKECQFEHNPNRGDFGENLAAATPDMWSTAQVVKSWADESADYDFARNTCKKGKVCGHYTQVVWRNTTAVGCAAVTCKKNSPFGDEFPVWQFWVCNYTPPGNFVGQRPY
ncbi:CAP domain-containing protein [Myxococcus sp. K15C18031901]|nr:CAP domain-containing protein [Myxococcus dinghuensis]MCP3102718.1 CAP domain-containing protein [Myxococcus dinghuensis]